MSETVSIDALKQRFPSEVINPYGEVLVVPSRLFQRGWESALESQGHRVFAGDYNREATFLVRIEKAEPKKVERFHTRENEAATKEPSNIKVDNWKRWTPNETRSLKDMVGQDLSVEEIAHALDRTPVSVERKIQRLKKKGELKPAGSSPAGTGAPNPVANDEDYAVKELLQAALQLFPRYRYACKTLLMEATSKLANKERWKSG